MELRMIDLRLALAAAVTIAIAAAHSWLGERKILGPLLASPLALGGARRAAFVRLTLRFAWHLTSLLLLGGAAILAALAAAPPDLGALLVLEISGAIFIASAAITLSYSDGRHIGWPLFLIVGILCWWTAAQHDGATTLASTRLPVGLAVAGVLFAASLLHAYWAARGGGGSPMTVPQSDGKPLFRPGRIGAGLVALALLAASLLVAQQASGLAPWPRALVKAGCWLLAALFLARAIGDFRWVGLFKRVKDTSFALSDTAAYTPLCLIIGLAVAALAL
jgi:hypothetical protein